MTATTAHPDHTDPTARHKHVLERFDALFGAPDLRALDDLCTPDLVNHTLTPGRPAGLAGTREFLETAPNHFHGDGWSECRVVAEGDYVMQFGVRGGQWLGGPFRGFALPEGDYRREFATMYRFVDGRIAERWAVRDDLTMLQQLGAFD